MNQLNAKDLLSAYIAGNFGNMNTTTPVKDRASNGTGNMKGGFDFILKESMKTSQKFERKEDAKLGEKTQEKTSPAITNKREFEKKVKQEFKVKGKDAKEEKPDVGKNEEVKNEKEVKNDEKPVKEIKVKQKDKDEVESVSEKDDTNENVESTDEVTKLNDEGKDVSKEDEAANQLLMFLSQVLNIEPKELQKMLKENNIDLKDVIKEQKVDELGSFIAKTKIESKDDEKKPEVKLNKDETEILKDVLQKLKANTKDNKGEVVSEQKVQVEDLRDPKEFMKFLENKGNSLKEKLISDKNEVPKSDEVVLKDKDEVQEAKMQTTLKESKVPEENQQKLPKEESNVKAVAESLITIKGNQNDKVTMQVVKEALNEKSSNAEKITEPKGMDGLNNNNGGNKTNLISSTQKVEQPSKLFRETIVDQIVDKAKLTLTNGKSEMSLELKPEHLGKISMKIATENGTVMAKIVADSEQVKAVLESNVNTLKETLENQGIKIQGFSISLASDQQNQNQNKEEFHNKENNGQSAKSMGSIGRTRTGISGTNAYEGSNISASDIRNYYGEKDSNINFTA